MNHLRDVSYFYFVFVNRQGTKRLTKEVSVPYGTEPTDEEVSVIRKETEAEMGEPVYMSYQEIGNQDGRYYYDLG